MSIPASIADKLETIAQSAYEANRAYMAGLDLFSIPAWCITPPDIKNHYRSAVHVLLTAPGIKLAEMHDAWAESMTAEGWTHGDTFNAHLRQHPWITPYAKLPAELKHQYELCRGIVETFRTKIFV